MPVTTNIPKPLKPYVSLGVRLTIPENLEGVGAVYGSCPWCGKENVFNITTDEGLWRCNVCVIGSPKGGGNIYTFLRVLHELSMKATPDHDYKRLAEEFTLLYPDTLKAWGVCKSIITDKWIVPGYNVQNGTREGGKIVTMYYYSVFDKSMKKRWGLPAGLDHGLHGPDLPTPVGGVQVQSRRKTTGPVYRCEGLKDAMALYEIALRCKINDDGGLSPTSNTEASLLWTGSVIAVPGATTFYPTWANVSSKRPDYTLYHNDYPKERPPNSGRFVQAGLDGTKIVMQRFANASDPPKEVKYLRWGEDTYHDPSLKDGYDVRDHLAGPQKNNTLGQRIRALGEILQRLQPPPQEWLPGRSNVDVQAGVVTIQKEECRDWKTLMSAMRPVLKPTDGIIRAFAAGLSSILSVPSIGDQLWFMVIGPPSSAKSTLCELWSTNRAYVLPKDTLTGLFSGWQMGLEKDENLSLAGEMQNKTLVIKDADLVLQKANCSEIMSQLRGLYDRAVRIQFKNRMSKDWEGLNSTVILCGTATLYSLDAAEKGARFLTVNIQPSHDYDLEDEIALRKAHEAFGHFEIHANGTMESRDTPEMLRLKQLTAGYISYLRENAVELIKRVTDPSGQAMRLCADLATFITYMRCRMPKKQTEKVEREMPYRLTSQLVRCARGLAVVFNRPTLDSYVMGHVKAIGLDTSEGKILALCDHLRSEGHIGSTANIAAGYIATTTEETLEQLRFLRRIQCVEIVPRPPSTAARQGKTFWRLTPRVSKLYDRIFGRTGTSNNPHGVTPQTGAVDDEE